MSAVARPVHIEQHDGRSLRYFASPTLRATGVPDLAWHVCTDLWRVLQLDGDEIDHILRCLRRDWREPATIATADGPVVIQPHFMGEGIFDAIEESMPNRTIGLSRARGSLRRGCTSATKAQVPHLTGLGYLAFHLDALGGDEPEG